MTDKNKHWTYVTQTLCRQVEDHMGLPKGELQSGASNQTNIIGRDAVIEEAFMTYRVPIAFLATFFGKTGQGTRNALTRNKEREGLRKFFHPPFQFEDVADFDDPEEVTEGRIRKPKSINYED